MNYMTEVSRYFLDSNIWIYALSDDDSEKAAKARELARKLKGQIFFSSQVANETCLNLKKKSSMTEVEIRRLLTSFFLNHNYVEMSERALVGASELRQRHSFSYWDSLVVMAASNANADILYSEDMQNGFVLDNRLRIVNPFIP